MGMGRSSRTEALAGVPDPRRRQGVRRPWTAARRFAARPLETLALLLT